MRHDRRARNLGRAALARPQRNILLISEAAEQYYWQPFVEACDRQKLQIFIFDTSRFPSQATVALQMSNIGAIQGGVRVECLSPKVAAFRLLDLSKIDVAWYVRAGRPMVDPAMNELEARFTQEEASSALRALFSAIDCKWVNHIDAINRAESSKFYQQSVAAKCGLKVPETLITNDPEHALEFSRKMSGGLLKTMGYISLDDGHAIYSNRFRTNEIAEAADAVRACPIFCQEYIEKRFEYRVMAIGNRVLACRIDSQASAKTMVDWRHYDFDNVEHKGENLPPAVEAKLLAFMNEIDLRFGAIDMIETPSGEFVFLEINPNGQWQWLQHYAGLPVPEAVAKMLKEL